MYQNRQLSGVTLCFIYTVFAVVIVFTVVCLYWLLSHEWLLCLQILLCSQLLLCLKLLLCLQELLCLPWLLCLQKNTVFAVAVVFDNTVVVFYSQWYLCFKKILLCLQCLFYLHWLSECMQGGMPEGLTDAFTSTRPTIWGKKEIVQTIIEFIHFWERNTTKKAYKRKQQKSEQQI